MMKTTSVRIFRYTWDSNTFSCSHEHLGSRSRVLNHALEAWDSTVISGASGLLSSTTQGQLLLGLVSLSPTNVLKHSKTRSKRQQHQLQHRSPKDPKTTGIRFLLFPFLELFLFKPSP